MDREAFFDAVRKRNGKLTQGQVDGFNAIFDEAERRRTPITHLAYMLATAWGETNKTMQPVEEGYYLGGEKARRFQRGLRYYPYYGRGLVQLTWAENYRKAGKRYGLDLENSPELALNPEVSINVMFDGMTEGWFTGHKLSDWVDNDPPSYVGARRIINGTNKAGHYAALARAFEGALTRADYGEVFSLPEPPEPDPDTPHMPPDVEPVEPKPEPQSLLGLIIEALLNLFRR